MSSFVTSFFSGAGQSGPDEVVVAAPLSDSILASSSNSTICSRLVVFSTFQVSAQSGRTCYTHCFAVVMHTCLILDFTAESVQSIHANICRLLRLTCHVQCLIGRRHLVPAVSYTAYVTPVHYAMGAQRILLRRRLSPPSEATACLLLVAETSKFLLPSCGI